MSATQCCAQCLYSVSTVPIDKAKLSKWVYGWAMFTTWNRRLPSLTASSQLSNLASTTTARKLPRSRNNPAPATHHGSYRSRPSPAAAAVHRIRRRHHPDHDQRHVFDRDRSLSCPGHTSSLHPPRARRHLPLDAPTRFESNDSPVDLRSIYFAWLNREIAIPDYNASATKLNDELKGAAAVHKFAFVERPRPDYMARGR